MNAKPGKSLAPATLDHLAALNGEIAALVRAGLPLEEGLAQIAEDFGRGTGDIAARLERETRAGKTLAEAVAAQGESLPPVYRAVVEAGLRSGRLAAALEGFAESAARVAELRRITAQAAVYPLIVAVLAWAMLVTVAALVLPGYEWLEIGDRLWAAPLAMPRRMAWAWGLGVPAVVLILAWAWWRLSASTSAESNRLALTRWIPGASRASRLSGQASFAELLGLLLKCRVPLVEALPLAANGSGVPELRHSAAALGARLAAGQPLSSRVEPYRELPPLVRLALAGSASDEGLQAGLARAAETYRDRATAWVAQLSVLAPVVATLATGVFVVAAYALLLLQPYVATLQEMASWH